MAKTTSRKNTAKRTAKRTTGKTAGKRTAKAKAGARVGKPRPKPKTKTHAGGAAPRVSPQHFGTDDARRALEITEILSREYPDAHCMLDFSNAFELLVATILAAQCTDAMVNQVTPALFAKYPTPQDFVDARAEDIQKMIFKTGFFRNKTKSIQRCCQALAEKHEGRVPATMEELLELGGVGRKTANCVLGNAFGIPGIVVDTHVKRLANRMGLTREANPDKIEADLAAVVPHAEWTHFSHLLADHGRAICEARKPKCAECPIQHLCPRIGVDR